MPSATEIVDVGKNKRAASFVIAAILSLATGCLLAASFDGTCVLWVVAGVAGYIACGSRAMAFWKMDEKIFEKPPRRHPSNLT